ncbi:MAG: hypothetical protein [Bacteriophage sp.]|nr:MAG: hypothetical protein [Bacteriophage sp.]
MRKIKFRVWDKCGVSKLEKERGIYNEII